MRLLAACLLFALFVPALGPAPAAAQEWTSPFGRQHPLTGKVYDVAADAFVSPDQLIGRLRAARYVLLGEIHDNADHHRLQGSVIAALAKAGRRPVVAFEQLDPTQQAALDRYLSIPGDAAGLGRAVRWSRAWPDWTLYQPIAEAALGAGLNIVGANVTDDAIRTYMRDRAAVDADFAARTFLNAPLPAADQRTLERELVAMHCGTTGPIIQQMAFAQRVRDAAFADTLVRKDEGDGGVLIAGSGHVRKDRGVPWVLRQMNPELAVAALGFVEVSEGLLQAPDYRRAFDAAALPFDYVWFTPATTRGNSDPCR